jgi:hypothetical protein
LFLNTEVLSERDKKERQLLALWLSVCEYQRRKIQEREGVHSAAIGDIAIDNVNKGPAQAKAAGI